MLAVDEHLFLYYTYLTFDARLMHHWPVSKGSETWVVDRSRSAATVARNRLIAACPHEMGTKIAVSCAVLSDERRVLPFSNGRERIYFSVPVYLPRTELPGLRAFPHGICPAGRMSGHSLAEAPRPLWS